MVNGLRLLALDEMGLAGALEELFTDEKVRAGWREARFVHNLANQRYSKTLETTVYRVAQESLTNVRKHADADHVSVVLLREIGAVGSQTRLILAVQDWGRGFVPEEKSAEFGHVGLQGMF